MAPKRIVSTFKPQLGDIWELGRHSLLVGDSGSPEQVAALLNGHPIDLIVTDPPYGVNNQSARDYKLAMKNSGRPRGKQLTHTAKQTIASDSTIEESLRALKRSLSVAEPLLKRGGAFYVFYPGAHARIFLEIIDQSKLSLRQQLVWVKNKKTFTRTDYKYRHENVAYGWKPGARHYFNSDKAATTLQYASHRQGDTKAELLIALAKYQELFNSLFDVQEARIVEKCLYHPTMKPIDLLSGFIRRSSRAGERVYDPFGGSCSTIIACEQEGRTGYAAEIDPHFAALALQRYRDTYPKATIRLARKVKKR